MFQRIKGAIDSRIAEEQARQKVSTSSASPSRSSSTARRASVRTESPSKRQNRTREREKGDRTSTKGPDPSEFDTDSLLDDESTESAHGDQSQKKEGRGERAENESAQPVEPTEKGEGTTGADVTPTSSSTSLEVPTDVRVKLRKLDKLESRYQELLRSYRIAHARVSLIEPFETALRENTPLTSIGDPSALVEYLNQMSLKSGMVMEELKRISSEKDSFRQRLDDAEKRTSEALEEVASLRKSNAELETLRRPSVDIVQAHNETRDLLENKETTDLNSKSPLLSSISSVRSPIRALFSPKSSSEERKEDTPKTEDFFSYESELPRVESELKQREAEVMTLRDDLAVARESTESMVKSLEIATRELHALRDEKKRQEECLIQDLGSMEKAANELKSKVQAAEDELATLKTQQNHKQSQGPNPANENLKAAETEIEKLRFEHSNKVTEIRAQLQEDIDRLKARISTMEGAEAHTEKRTETLNGLVSTLRNQVARAEKAKDQLVLDIKEKELAIAESNTTVSRLRGELMATSQTSQVADANASPINEDNRAATSKKKKKKNRKGGKSVTNVNEQNGATVGGLANGLKLTEDSPQDMDPFEASPAITARLQEELNTLRDLLQEKDASIDRLRRELSDTEDLREENEGLKEELVIHGDEHIQAEIKVKELQAEKVVLEERVKISESEIENLRSNYASSSEGSEKLHMELSRDLEQFQSKVTVLQTDLSAAEQLATSRFKDLTELRGVLQRAQPELATLRAEVSELKLVNTDLKSKSVALDKLEASQKDLHSEILSLRREVAERDTEIKALKNNVSLESKGRTQAEEQYNDAQNDLARVLVEKKIAMESKDKTVKELAKAQEEISVARGRIRELEQHAAKLDKDIDSLREDAELKVAQYASAQSLMSSMRDQTNEIGMQMKEARDRCESLEEELGDAHRLLSERSREGETMRRLLADVEARSDSKVREMRERMEVAVEERDRAEDEANTIGRRRARELEELRGRVRDAERSLKQAEDEREELERGQKDWRRRREELDARAEQSAQEVKEVRQAMGELRDALDESEKQARDLEKQRVALRRSAEETQIRLEKLQKSNKSMSDELQSVRIAKARGLDSETRSSRSSLDSSPSRIGLSSPQPRRKESTTTTSEVPAGPGGASIDYVYLKNVLLQFLEQRDKKHQIQLIPVLGMLLHFDRNEEQRWMSAISTK